MHHLQIASIEPPEKPGSLQNDEIEKSDMFNSAIKIFIITFLKNKSK